MDGVICSPSLGVSTLTVISADFRRGKPIVRITAEAVPQQALADLVEGARRYPLWTHLAYHDIRQRFRRSILGPFWLTLTMGVLIGAMGLVFSTLFQQHISETLPYIATGIILWGLLTSCINEGTTAFISAETFIRNVPAPLSVHFFRMMARNVFIWLFNMAIYLVVIIAFRIPLNWNLILFVPGFALFLLNTTWISLVSAIISTRYRDMPQVIANVMQVIFYVTPIFWSPSAIAHRPAFVGLNPFYHLLAIVREPLLGSPPSAYNWLFCTGLAIVGLMFTAWLYRRAHARISYWV